MSQKPQQVERDDATSIYDADPILGKYLSHYPSNRLRLLMIGGIVYAVPVALLQLIFFNTDNTAVAIFLPITFAGIAGAVLWWILHHWNREVVLYQRGFSFRQGSATAYILYSNVLQLTQSIERIGFLGIARTVYNYTLRTDMDETLIVNNVYSNPDKLTRSLEAFIARDRLPIMRDKIAKGNPATFGERLQLRREGIMLDNKELFWHEFTGHRVKGGQIFFQTKSDDAWGMIEVSEVDNPVLLIAMLKDRGQLPTQTQ